MELALVIWAVGTLPAVSLAMCFILFFAILVDRLRKKPYPLS